MNKSGDIDIDFADREKILELIKHVPASMNRDNQFVKHNTGIYVNPIPKDPITGLSNIDYQAAEGLGYMKLDFLNVHVYGLVKNNDHLIELMNTNPPWEKLYDREFVEKIIHISNHYAVISRMPEPVNSIPRLAMLLSIIRPAKRHLIGLPWRDVAKTVWQPDPDGGYGYKKSHGVAYATLVAVHMNLIANLVS